MLAYDYICPDCGKAYTRSEYARRHARKTHARALAPHEVIKVPKAPQAGSSAQAGPLLPANGSNGLETPGTPSTGPIPAAVNPPAPELTPTQPIVGSSGLPKGNAGLLPHNPGPVSTNLEPAPDLAALVERQRAKISALRERLRAAERAAEELRPRLAVVAQVSQF